MLGGALLRSKEAVVWEGLDVLMRGEADVAREANNLNMTSGAKRAAPVPNEAVHEDNCRRLRAGHDRQGQGQRKHACMHAGKQANRQASEAMN